MKYKLWDKVTFSGSTSSYHLNSIGEWVTDNTEFGIIDQVYTDTNSYRVCTRPTRTKTTGFYMKAESDIHRSYDCPNIGISEQEIVESIVLVTPVTIWYKCLIMNLISLTDKYDMQILYIAINMSCDEALILIQNKHKDPL